MNHFFSESLGGSDFLFYLCIDKASIPAREAGRVKDIDGLRRPTKPFLALASDRKVERLTWPKGKAFTDVTFCDFKLRKLESSHRGNATVSDCGGGLYPFFCVVPFI